jgi:hypothetical protein
LFNRYNHIIPMLPSRVVVVDSIACTNPRIMLTLAMRIYMLDMMHEELRMFEYSVFEQKIIHTISSNRYYLFLHETSEVIILVDSTV